MNITSQRINMLFHTKPYTLNTVQRDYSYMSVIVHYNYFIKQGPKTTKRLCPCTTLQQFKTSEPKPLYQKSLYQKHCTKTIVPKPLYQNHCNKTIVTKPVYQNHCTKTNVTKSLYHNHSTKTIVPKPLYQTHCTS